MAIYLVIAEVIHLDPHSMQVIHITRTNAHSNKPGLSVGTQQKALDEYLTDIEASGYQVVSVAPINETRVLITVRGA